MWQNLQFWGKANLYFYIATLAGRDQVKAWENMRRELYKKSSDTVAQFEKASKPKKKSVIFWKFIELYFDWNELGYSITPLIL